MSTKRVTTAIRRGGFVEIVDLTRGEDDFAADVRVGLTSTSKTLSPRYFYDELGSILFDAICRVPEYYVARAEAEILRNHSDEIVAQLPRPLRMVELGPGRGEKTRLLLDATLRQQSEMTYYPIDIDVRTLAVTADALAADYASLGVTAIGASFEDGLSELAVRLRGSDQPTLALFLGSTIGNLGPAEQRELLRAIRATLRPGDALLLGADAVKSERILIPAYDDVLGVTSAFNRNLLVRINRELGGTFDVSAFRHQISYDHELQRIEMHLVSIARQHVAIRAAGIEANFSEGESIHTESSYKFTRDAIEALARDARFTLAFQWTDSNGWFGENLLVAI